MFQKSSFLRFTRARWKEISPRSLKTCLFLREAAGLSFFFYQMHRDTKLHELIGERENGWQRCLKLGHNSRCVFEGEALQQIVCIVFSSLQNQRKTHLQPAKTASLWEIRFRRCSDHEGACTRGGRVGAQPHSPRPSFCCKAEINSAAKSRNALNINKSTDRNIMNHKICIYTIIYYFILWKRQNQKKQRFF